MRYRKGWIALIVLALLSPLGLLAIGVAWGEWDLETIKDKVGYTPEGMRTAQETQHEAPFPDYEIPGLAGSWWETGAGTAASAVIGAALTAATALLIARLVKHGRIS